MSVPSEAKRNWFDRYIAGLKSLAEEAPDDYTTTDEIPLVGGMVPEHLRGLPVAPSPLQTLKPMGTESALLSIADATTLKPLVQGPLLAGFGANMRLLDQLPNISGDPEENQRLPFTDKPRIPFEGSDFDPANYADYAWRNMQGSLLGSIGAGTLHPSSWIGGPAKGVGGGLAAFAAKEGANIPRLARAGELIRKGDEAYDEALHGGVGLAKAAGGAVGDQINRIPVVGRATRFLSSPSVLALEGDYGQQIGGAMARANTALKGRGSSLEQELKAGSTIPRILPKDKVAAWKIVKASKDRINAELNALAPEHQPHALRLLGDLIDMDNAVQTQMTIERGMLSERWEQVRKTFTNATDLADAQDEMDEKIADLFDRQANAQHRNNLGMLQAIDAIKRMPIGTPMDPARAAAVKAATQQAVLEAADASKEARRYAAELRGKPIYDPKTKTMIRRQPIWREDRWYENRDAIKGEDPAYRDARARAMKAVDDAVNVLGESVDHPTMREGRRLFDDHRSLLEDFNGNPLAAINAAGVAPEVIATISREVVNPRQFMSRAMDEVTANRDMVRRRAEAAIRADLVKKGASKADIDKAMPSILKEARIALAHPTFHQARPGLAGRLGQKEFTPLGEQLSRIAKRYDQHGDLFNPDDTLQIWGGRMQEMFRAEELGVKPMRRGIVVPGIGMTAVDQLQRLPGMGGAAKQLDQEWLQEAVGKLNDHFQDQGMTPQAAGAEAARLAKDPAALLRHPAMRALFKEDLKTAAGLTIGSWKEQNLLAPAYHVANFASQALMGADAPSYGGTAVDPKFLMKLLKKNAGTLFREGRVDHTIDPSLAPEFVSVLGDKVPPDWLGNIGEQASIPGAETMSATARIPVGIRLALMGGGAAYAGERTGELAGLSDEDKAKLAGVGGLLGGLYAWKVPAFVKGNFLVAGTMESAARKAAGITAAEEALGAIDLDAATGAVTGTGFRKGYYDAMRGMMDINDIQSFGQRVEGPVPLDPTATPAGPATPGPTQPPVPGPTVPIEMPPGRGARPQPTAPVTTTVPTDDLVPLVDDLAEPAAPLLIDDPFAKVTKPRPPVPTEGRPVAATNQGQTYAPSPGVQRRDWTRFDGKPISPVEGWKIHLSVKPENYDKVIAYLRRVTGDQGKLPPEYAGALPRTLDQPRGRLDVIRWKHLSGGAPEDGKDFTIYVGHRDDTEDLADRINRDIGDYLTEAKDLPQDAAALWDDIPVGKAHMRFEISRDSSDLPIKFDQYGRAGISYLYDDRRAWAFDQMSVRAGNAPTVNEPAMRQRSHDYLDAYYGEFYTGTRGNPIGDLGTGARKAAPAAGPPTYQAAQAAMDAFDSQMAAKYGADAVQNWNDYTPEEIAEAERLLQARDALVPEATGLPDVPAPAPTADPLPADVLEANLARSGLFDIVKNDVRTAVQQARTWGILDQIEPLAGQALTAEQIARELAPDLASRLPRSQQITLGQLQKVVNDARMGLGIPDVTYDPTFSTWQEAYRARQAAPAPVTGLPDIPADTPLAPMPEGPLHGPQFGGPHGVVREPTDPMILINDVMRMPLTNEQKTVIFKDIENAWRMGMLDDIHGFFLDPGMSQASMTLDMKQAMTGNPRAGGPNPLTLAGRDFSRIVASLRTAFGVPKAGTPAYDAWREGRIAAEQAFTTADVQGTIALNRARADAGLTHTIKTVGEEGPLDRALAAQQRAASPEPVPVPDPVGPSTVDDQRPWAWQVPRQQFIDRPSQTPIRFIEGASYLQGDEHMRMLNNVRNRAYQRIPESLRRLANNPDYPISKPPSKANQKLIDAYRQAQNDIFEYEGQMNLKHQTQLHRQQVMAALEDGEPVPAEVLADYPDLMGMAPNAAPAPVAGQQPDMFDAPTAPRVTQTWNETLTQQYQAEMARVRKELHPDYHQYLDNPSLDYSSLPYVHRQAIEDYHEAAKAAATIKWATPQPAAIANALDEGGPIIPEPAPPPIEPEPLPEGLPLDAEDYPDATPPIEEPPIEAVPPGGGGQPPPPPEGPPGPPPAEPPMDPWLDPSLFEVPYGEQLDTLFEIAVERARLRQAANPASRERLAALAVEADQLQSSMQYQNKLVPDWVDNAEFEAQLGGALEGGLNGQKRNYEQIKQEAIDFVASRFKPYEADLFSPNANPQQIVNLLRDQIPFTTRGEFIDDIETFARDKLRLDLEIPDTFRERLKTLEAIQANVNRRLNWLPDTPVEGRPEMIDMLGMSPAQIEDWTKYLPTDDKVLIDSTRVIFEQTDDALYVMLRRAVEDAQARAGGVGLGGGGLGGGGNLPPFPPAPGAWTWDAPSPNFKIGELRTSRAVNRSRGLALGDIGNAPAPMELGDYYRLGQSGPRIKLGSRGDIDAIQRHFAEKNGRLTPNEVYTMATSYGATPQQAARLRAGWDDFAWKAREAGRENANNIHIDYQDISNLIYYGKMGPFPFLTWQAKAIPKYLQMLAHHPGLIVALNEYNKASEREIEEAGLPQSFRNFTQQGGMIDALAGNAFGREGNVYANPLPVVFPYSDVGREQSDYASPTDQVLGAMQSVGLGPSPLVTMPLYMAGLTSDMPINTLRTSPMLAGISQLATGHAIDPELGLKQATRGIRERLAPGETQPTVTGDPIRDYYIRKRIASVAVERTGKPPAGEYLKAIQEGTGPIWANAQRDIEREMTGRTAISAVAPVRTRLVDTGEQQIRQAQVEEGITSAALEELDRQPLTRKDLQYAAASLARDPLDREETLEERAKGLRVARRFGEARASAPETGGLSGLGADPRSQARRAQLLERESRRVRPLSASARASRDRAELIRGEQVLRQMGA